LGLRVLSKRSDNYHNIASTFIELEFHDTLTFELHDEFSLSCNIPEVPVDSSNLISKAYSELLNFKPYDDSHYKINIEKHIPMGGGLGGGSSNAANTLTALNYLWNCNLSDEKLCEIGKKIGADVPFFIKGGIQNVWGIGDMLSPVELDWRDKYTFLLVLPEISISTPWAYKSLNISLHEDNTIPKFSPLTEPVNWQLFENDFERVIRSTYPEIDEIKLQLQDCGAVFAGMSGSGSTMFGIFDSRELAQHCAEKFSHYQTIVTFPKSS
jgi:4-diphosphocytidyl-2-C-methyl-D-erythritol kinase